MTGVLINRGNMDTDTHREKSMQRLRDEDRD